MPFDGNGNYVLPSPAYPAVSGTIITATNRNTIDADLQNALSNCVTRDGQSPLTAALPMGGNKLSNMGAGANAGDSIRFEQLFGAGPATAAAARSNLAILNSGVALNAAGVAALNFTGLPAGLKRIVVGVDSLVSLTGTTTFQLLLGTSAGLYAGTYSGSWLRLANPDFVRGSTYTTNFGFDMLNFESLSGQFILTLMDATNNTWLLSFIIYGPAGAIYTYIGAGVTRLPGAIDRVQLKVSSGANFSSGKANLLYE